MNDFLEQVWLDNPVRKYLIVATIIILMLLLKRLISRYVAGIFFNLVQKVWKEIDKKTFTSLLVQPLGMLLVILVSIISLHKLTFPSLLNIEIYNYSLKHIIHSIATFILIVAFIWLLLRVIDFIARILEIKADLTPSQGDNQLVVFFRDFFKVIIGIIGVLMVLSNVFDVNIASLITGLSIVGAAIALALRESLENLIASFIIFFDKPFTTGDLVKVHQITGVVEKIGLRSTRIRSDQKTYVSVPNKQMVDSLLDNLSMRTQRRGDLRMELSVQTPSGKLDELVAGVKKILERKEIEDSNVLFSEIASHSFVVQSDYYTAPLTVREFNAIRQDVNLKAIRLAEDLEIELAGASTDVRLKKLD